MTPARHTKLFCYYYFNYFRDVAMLQKFAGPLVEPLFCGTPVRPNMLNMPKSASGPRRHYVRLGPRWCQITHTAAPRFCPLCSATVAPSATAELLYNRSPKKAG